jgi:hypothetical protein
LANPHNDKDFHSKENVDKMTNDTQNVADNQVEKPLIRFIDSDYRELFQIPDGGNIRVTYPPGDDRGTIVLACKFLDEYHTRIGGSDYDVRQWAERMDALGARYEPEFKLPSAELATFAAGDDKFYKRNREEGNTCVGQLAGNFGENGEHFYQYDFNRRDVAITPGFQAELQAAVYALRQTVLKDADAMTDYCRSHPEALIEKSGDFERYGFKLETANRQYYVNCIPQAPGKSPRDAFFSIFAYDDGLAPKREQTRETAPEAASEAASVTKAEELGGYTSVLAAIEKGKTAPKPPRKAKAPSKRKNKDGAEL